MGYGVSQVLPILTEMLRPDGPHMFLLQQPEIHLHPSAQAALGTLFCSMASSGKQQIIVETHSDHLIDRVRMAVRDRAPGLKPEDVSILYFERGELDVKIRSISIDEQGNITGAPLNYRKFFMEEVERSIGLRKLETCDVSLISFLTDFMCLIIDNDVRSDVFGTNPSVRGHHTAGQHQQLLGESLYSEGSSEPN